MRKAFRLASGLSMILSLLCLIKLVTVFGDPLLVTRWMSAAILFAFLASFWEITRWRYAVTGFLRTEPATFILLPAGLAILTATILIFTITS